MISTGSKERVQHSLFCDSPVWAGFIPLVGNSFFKCTVENIFSCLPKQIYRIRANLATTFRSIKRFLHASCIAVSVVGRHLDSIWEIFFLLLPLPLRLSPTCVSFAVFAFGLDLFNDLRLKAFMLKRIWRLRPIQHPIPSLRSLRLLLPPHLRLDIAAE